MSEKLNIEPRVRSLISYLNDIEIGLIKIPSFQRDFVWNRDKIKELFDSIKNRYPIGSILLWKSNEDLNEENVEIGSYKTPSDNNDKVYILDGFQRLSTLFGCLTNPHKTLLKRNEKAWKDFFELYYDLEDETFNYIRKNTQPEPFQIPVYILMNSSDFRQYARKEFEKINDEIQIEKYYDRADKLSGILLDYKIASVDINNANISEAIEIFSRTNSTGAVISFDWTVNALSSKQGFRFADEIDKLIEELTIYNFDNIDRNIIFRCIQSSFGKLYIDNTKIEALARRNDFSIITKNSIPKIKEAIKFLFEDLYVLDSKLLPYNIQLIFIMDFFKKFEHPTNKQKEKLKDWFWITTYSNYFTIYSLANQRNAYNHFQRFLNGNEENPVYYDNKNIKFTTAEFPEKINMKSVRAKALALFMLNFENNFNKIDSNEVEKLRWSKLFSYIDLSQNDIPFIDLISLNENEEYNIKIRSSSKIKKTKDYSILLDKNYTSMFSEYFINDEMRILYDEFNDDTQYNNTYKILDIRRDLIQKAEKKFVESKGLIYSNQNS